MADIYIYDIIGEDWWSGEGMSGKKFRKTLADLGSPKEVNVYIDSPGGNVFDGLNIYNQMKRHKAQFNIFVDGMAASAASIVAMAGDKITMAQNTFMMIHNAWSVAIGNADDMRKVADELDKISGELADTYVSRTGQDRTRINDMMAAETWLTASEAVDMGFADEIEENKAAKAYADCRRFNFVRTPTQVAAAVRPRHMGKYQQNLMLNRARLGLRPRAA